MNDREFEIFLMLARVEVEQTVKDGGTVNVSEIASHAWAAKLMYAEALREYHVKANSEA
jgi:hypothetical protein